MNILIKLLRMLNIINDGLLGHISSLLVIYASISGLIQVLQNVQPSISTICLVLAHSAV